METPSLTRRVTRSQTMADENTNNNIPISRKIEDSEKGVSKSRHRTGKQQEKSVLIDITNDSPIVGLAMGSLKTPSSSSTLSKKRINNSQAKNNKITGTPGSGEALLRGQVKTLLQKVEEEAELSKLSLEHRSFLHLQGFINSPAGLLAPTPANTPQILSLSGNESFKNSCLASVLPSLVQEQFMISQMVVESPESEKSLITRSLLMDFSEKSEGSDSSECSSVLTNEGGIPESEGKEKTSMEDDDVSVWSIQVNASTKDDYEEEGGIEEDDENGDYEGEEEEEADDDGGLVDALCEGISKINVNREKTMPKFSGRHTRFVYNSNDELEGEEECGGEEGEVCVSPGILQLKGLPTPKGKHLRFHEELEDEDDN
ncbi:hypothetical protein LOK49_LG04G01241 [Camellia lanceoleosa]|uniref:Uncharacterized protein n=1 Tax=Camellia lanceoleosa TaxID=1840588 RepID=A0ACC0I320_9ERIC|nr:hypothetical protein LOK49_LG04G01241 [Camellia lanceoleosa]